MVSLGASKFGTQHTSTEDFTFYLINCKHFIDQRAIIVVLSQNGAQLAQSEDFMSVDSCV